MKKRAKELDVDFIGGQNNPLTKKEQLAISTFIKKIKKRPGKTTNAKQPNWKGDLRDKRHEPFNRGFYPM